MIRYFDNNATTAMDRDIGELMLKLCTENYGNPNSVHSMGLDSNRLLEESRLRVARVLEVEPSEVFFTSSATESINWILRSSATFRGRKNRVVTTSIEHKATLDTLKDLKNSYGIEVIELRPERDGIVDPEKVMRAVDSETFLVSIMAANNVTGAIQPFDELGERLKAKLILYHVDAVQSIGKFDFKPRRVGCTFASFSAHKFHGPKGVGITFINKGSPLRPLITGGGQERGMRSGTQNVPGIVAASLSMERAVQLSPDTNDRLSRYKERLKVEVEKLGGRINSPLKSISNTLNVSFPGIRSEVLANFLSREGVFVGTSSACSSRNDGGQYVLDSMGLDSRIATSAIRISMSRFTTDEDIEIIVEKLKQSIPALKF